MSAWAVTLLIGAAFICGFVIGCIFEYLPGGDR